MAVVPKIIKNFNLLVGGYGFAGIAEEVRLPDVKIRGEEHRAGGMDAPMMMDMGMDRLEMGFTMAEHHPEVMRYMGKLNQNAVDLLFKAAQVDDVNVIPYAITVKGMYTDMRLGTVKNGTMTKLESTVSCRYFKLQIAGKTIWEIDVDRMIRFVDGFDELSGIKAAIGL